MPTFELPAFIEACSRACREAAPEREIRELVTECVTEPSSALRALGEPERAQIQRLYHSPELTILNVIWAAGMTLMPHDHRMWAVIGVYSGREDNIFWRRLPDRDDGRVEAAGAKALSTGDVVSLGRDIIHSVTNPIGRLTGAIHVYGGDFFNQPRSEWDPETLVERPFDVERAQRLFEAANE